MLLECLLAMIVNLEQLSQLKCSHSWNATVLFKVRHAHTQIPKQSVCEGESQTVHSVNRRRCTTQPDPLVHRITSTVGFHSQLTQTSICYKCLCARDHNRKYKHDYEKNDDKFIK